MTNAAPQPRPALQPRPWLGPLMVLGGGIALGFAPIGLRLGLDELGPQAIAFWRYLFAVPMLLILVLAVDRRLPAKPNIAVFLAALFFLAMGFVLELLSDANNAIGGTKPYVVRDEIGTCNRGEIR